MPDNGGHVRAEKERIGAMPQKATREQKTQSINDPVRSLIIKTASEQGKTLSFLSRKIGRNPAYLHQYIWRNIPKHLSETTRHLLSRLLKIEESRLRGQLRMIVDPEPTNLESPDELDEVISTRQIPTYGHRVGGLRGEIKLSEENKTGDVPAPPALVAIRDAYALYVVGELMEPRYFAGELVYVHPGLPVRNGDFVVLQIIDNNAGKPGGAKDDSSPLALVRRQVNSTTFAQINPYETMVLAKDQIVATHRIILAG